MRGTLLTAAITLSLIALGSANGKIRIRVKEICKDTKCGCDDVCVPQQVVCKKEPCIPVPRCFKRGTHPCSRCRCPPWTFCIIDISGKGNLCIPPIVIPIPMPPPIDPCALVLCPEKTRCVEGECIPVGVCPLAPEIGPCVELCSFNSDCQPDELCCSIGCGHDCRKALLPPSVLCNDVECEKGKLCVLREVLCINPPCIPATDCVPLEENDCARVKCGFGTVCILTITGGPACVPNDPLCALVRCPKGQICEEGRCIPDGPVDRCAAVSCIIGSICDPNTGQCNPVLLSKLCDKRRCEEDEVCVLQEVVCITFPCFPTTLCIPEDKNPCEDDSCKPGTVCVISLDGSPKCLPDDPNNPTDPCANVNCGLRQQCIEGICVPLGKCPDPGDQIGICVDTCSKDSDCPSSLLCCSNGCGHTCQQPAIKPSQLCQTVDCREGLVCVLREVQCIRAPCPPLPDCIPPDESPCRFTRCSLGFVCVITNSGATCRPDEPGDSCSLPLDPGPCRASINRYFFNELTGKCQQFTYGGCLGNANNFFTLEECERRCGAPDPCKDFPCPEGQICQVEGDTSCDPSKGPCPLRPLIIRCVDPCTLPSETGPCKAFFSRWFYNTETKACEQFIYGGCLGNENRFDTEEACEQQCEPDLCATVKCADGEVCIIQGDKPGELPPRRALCVDICFLPADAGPCEALITRWHYDADEDLCRTFTYGGCQGNKNNFVTFLQCQDQCEKKFLCEPLKCPEGEVCIIQGDCDPTRGPCPDPARRAQCVSICLLGVDPGPCDNDVPRFFYDSDDNECKPFSYGGCEGNENNFETLKECQAQCEKKKDPCEGHECPTDKICIVRKVKCSRGSVPAPTCVPKEKRGGCPNAFKQKFGLIACPDPLPPSECKNDYDCPRKQKCCRKVCGQTVCADPVDTREKKGMCPALTPFGVICDLFECAFDSECEGRKKCCVNACGSSVCLDPVKKGICPAADQVTTCDYPCKSDQDCPGRLKCCRNKEGDTYCVAPKLHPHGKCPDTSGITTTCEVRKDSCLSDADCPARQTCCPFGCGKRCLKLSRYA